MSNVQLRSVTDQEVTTLAIHEEVMGVARCGTAARPWNGHEMEFVAVEGEVTCLRCLAMPRTAGGSTRPSGWERRSD